MKNEKAKQAGKKLRIKRDPIRVLDPDDLKNVAGGYTTIEIPPK